MSSGHRQIAIAASCAALTLAPSGMRACLMRDMSFNAQHVAVGRQYVLESVNPLNRGGGAASISLAVAGLGIRSGSLALLNNSWGLTARHVVEPVLSFPDLSVYVNTGPNFLSDLGLTIPVDALYLHPSSGIDLCLVHFQTPQAAVAPAVFGSALDGELLTGVGFGLAASPIEAPQLTGDVRAFRGISTPGDADIQGFDTSLVGASATRLNSASSIDGRGMSGDSGGPIFNEEGALCGIAIQASQGTGIIGDTYFIRLDNPQVREWILATTALTPACPADVGQQGGVAGSDGVLDNNDFIAFISSFFAGDSIADRGVTGGVAGSDGEFDNNDFIVFIGQFFAGCG